MDTWIADDTRFVHIKGDGGIETCPWGNPRKVIVERRSHGFVENYGFRRVYPDGVIAEETFQLLEVFGSTNPDDFTPQRARQRAEAYATHWALSIITHDSIRTATEVGGAIDAFRQEVNNPRAREEDLEKCLDAHPWMLERALSCAQYHSQVSIPEELMSRSDQGIRPDKLVVRHDGLVDVLDLKKATVRLVVGRKNRRKASAHVSEAEAQIDTYIRLLEEPNVRDYLANLGIRVLRPRGLLVMGRRPAHLDDWEDVRSRLGVLIYTYDDVLDELDRLLGWLVTMEGRSPHDTQL